MKAALWSWKNPAGIFIDFLPWRLLLKIRNYTLCNARCQVWRLLCTASPLTNTVKYNTRFLTLFRAVRSFLTWRTTIAHKPPTCGHLWFSTTGGLNQCKRVLASCELNGWWLNWHGAAVILQQVILQHLRKTHLLSTNYYAWVEESKIGGDLANITPRCVLTSTNDFSEQLGSITGTRVFASLFTLKTNCWHWHSYRLH